MTILLNSLVISAEKILFSVNIKLVGIQVTRREPKLEADSDIRQNVILVTIIQTEHQVWTQRYDRVIVNKESMICKCGKLISGINSFVRFRSVCVNPFFHPLILINDSQTFPKTKQRMGTQVSKCYSSCDRIPPQMVKLAPDASVGIMET